MYFRKRENLLSFKTPFMIRALCTLDNVAEFLIVYLFHFDGLPHIPYIFIQ